MRVRGVSIALVLAAAPLAAQVEPPREWVDPATGHRIVRLSDEPGSQSLYFHQNPYTAMGDKMVITTPGGIATVDLSTRKIEPIVEGPARNLVVGARTRQVFYLKDDTAYVTHLDTKATRAIVTRPELRGASGFTVNADETLIAGSYVVPGAAPPATPAPAASPGGATPAVIESRLETRWAQRLPMALYTVRIASGEWKSFHPSNDWLNHVQFSPSEPDLLMFCHEGPWHKVERIWTIRTDGSGLRKVHTRTMAMEIFGHEFWSSDGKKIWYDLQTPKGEKFWLASFDVATGERTRYPVARDQWSVHFNVSPDGKLFAGDGGGPEMVAQAQDGQWIYLFRPEGRALRAERLVDMRAHDYKLEPNVTFTPDRRHVVFRSNMHGANHAYAVEIRKGPRLFLVGDSTVKNGNGDGAGGLWGWGEPLAAFFDPQRIEVQNRALGGRSSRTFQTEKRWDAVLAELRPGDFVMIQFGHNDVGDLFTGTRPRASLPGVGDETEKGTVETTGAEEVVHTYGYYLRKYVREAKAKGATPIVCSLVPRKIWKDRHIVRADHARWAAETARSEGALFLDLNGIVARRYEALGPAKVDGLFGDEHTHTNASGAELTAKSVIAGLKNLDGCPLCSFFSAKARN